MVRILRHWVGLPVGCSLPQVSSVQLHTRSTYVHCRYLRSTRTPATYHTTLPHAATVLTVPHRHAVLPYTAHILAARATVPFWHTPTRLIPRGLPVYAMHLYAAVTAPATHTFLPHRIPRFGPFVPTAGCMRPVLPHAPHTRFAAGSALLTPLRYYPAFTACHHSPHTLYRSRTLDICLLHAVRRFYVP